MRIFLTGSTLFATALVVHFLIWTIRAPKSQTRTLLVIFLAVLTIGFFAGCATGPGWMAASYLDWLHAASFYIALMLGYTATYSAIEFDSPTLSIMRFISRASAGSVGDIDLKEFARSHPFIGKRLALMVRDGMMIAEEDRYRLGSGRFPFIRFILFYRRLYSPGKEGG